MKPDLRFPVVILALGITMAACQRTSGEARRDSLPAADSSMAQACTLPAYRQFDFWIGEWDVQRPDGQHAGINHIEPILRGCALHERWVSANPPYRGESFNTYRTDTGSWHQTWIDNAGGMLLLDGRYTTDRMILEGTTTDSTGGKVLNRITWVRLDSTGNRIRQHWETSNDGKNWQTSFDGIYNRRP